MFGDTLGVVWDGLVMIFGKCSEHLRNFEISELSRNKFPVTGCSTQFVVSLLLDQKTLNIDKIVCS